MNEPARPETSRTVLIVLLMVCLVAIGAVLALVLRPAAPLPEAVVEVVEAASPAEAGLHVAHVIDTLTNSMAIAEEGGRYKVLIVDEAREGASGIAKIAGLVTFVPDTRRGDLVIIEVSRLKRSTADAILIERLASGQAVPERTERADQSSRRDDAPASAMVGQEFRGTVVDTGREGDGIVKVDGKVVFVKGAALGEHVVFRVTEDAGRFARGEVVSKSDTPFASETISAAPPSAPRDPAPKGEVPVAVGDELDVEVVEADRRNPGVDGVARIDRFVVFVPGTQPGDRARIRITEVRSRAAQAEVLERLPATP